MPAITITSIEPQKKKRNRFSIFLDNAYAFGLDVATVAKFNLKRGDVLTAEQLSEILLHEEKQQIQERAFRLLAGRAHSEKELRLKLSQKGFSRQAISSALDELKEKGFIDDHAFATAFARQRLLKKPVGKFRLSQELKQKGVDEKVVDSVIDEVYGDTSEEELARKLLQKQKQRYAGLTQQEQKRRLNEFLLRRGFSWETIAEIIEPLAN